MADSGSGSPPELAPPSWPLSDAHVLEATNLRTPRPAIRVLSTIFSAGSTKLRLGSRPESAKLGLCSTKPTACALLDQQSACAAHMPLICRTHAADLWHVCPRPQVGRDQKKVLPPSQTSQELGRPSSRGASQAEPLLELGVLDAQAPHLLLEEVGTELEPLLQLRVLDLQPLAVLRRKGVAKSPGQEETIVRRNRNPYLWVCPQGWLKLVPSGRR